MLTAPSSSIDVARPSDRMPTIRYLPREAPGLPPDMDGLTVARLFEGHRTTTAFAIIRDGVPVGIIDRLGFMSRFATRYGRDLYGKKPISHMMDSSPLVVDADQTVDMVSQQIFTSKPRALHTGFIVVDDGRYDGVVTGITLLQALAQSLAATNEHLRIAQASLVQSEKMAALGALVAGIAHEINTPIGSALTASTAFSERVVQFRELTAGGTIRRSDIDRFSDSAQQAAGFMQSNIHRAAELISGFKQIAVDQTSDERRRFHLLDCCDNVALSLQPRLRKANVAMTIDCPPDIELDSFPGAIAQVITNLVMNALEHAFSDDGSGSPPRRIAMDAAPVPAQDGRPPAVELVVADNGSGIPESVAPRIFDPFFTTRRGVGGTGLGLHIVYNLVSQRLGGLIRLESSGEAGPGGGARFALVVPLSAP